MLVAYQIDGVISCLDTIVYIFALIYRSNLYMAKSAGLRVECIYCWAFML